MMNRKFALVAGVLALAMVPSAIHAEYMTITLQELSSTGTVLATDTFTDQANGSNSAVNYTGTSSYNRASQTQDGVQVQFWLGGGTHNMATNGSFNFGVDSTPTIPDFSISFVGSSSNSPGGSSAFMNLTSLQVNNNDPNSDHTLVVTATSGDFTSPVSKVFFSQSGTVETTSGSLLSLTATSYLDTNNTNYASTANGSSPTANGSTVYATPTASGNNINTSGQSDTISQYSPNGNTTTYIPNLTSSAYSLTSYEKVDVSIKGQSNLDPNPFVSAPEPSTLVLAFLGLSCVGGQRLLSRRKKQAVAV